MAQTGTCPICEWPVREHRRCPCCGWELKSDELILGDPGLPERFQRTLNETRKRWQEAAEAYRAGRMGFGEEAIERLRRRLQEEGFGIGEAFSKWAKASAPVHSASGLPQHHAGGTPEKVRKHRPLLAVEKALFHFIRYSRAYLAFAMMGWLIPLLEPAIALPLLLLIFALHPIVAALVMIAIGSLQVWYGVSREIYWHAIAWGATWFLGAIAAVAGVFQWYALLVGGILGISLVVPGVVVPAWHDVLWPIVAVDLLLSLYHIWGPALGISPAVAATAATLMLIAVLVGVGAYQPFEIRRFRRSLAIFLAFAGAALLLWRPVVVPAAQLVTSMVRSTAQLAIQVVSDSPLGKWYRSGAVVTIQSDPPGAAVHFDSRLVGATPVTLEKVRPGEYRVVLSKPGYRDVSQVVVVKRRESLTLSFKLDPLVTPRPMRPASRTVSPLVPPPPPPPEPPPPPPPPEPPPSPPNP